MPNRLYWMTRNVCKNVSVIFYRSVPGRGQTVWLLQQQTSALLKSDQQYPAKTHTTYYDGIFNNDLFHINFR